MTHSDGPHRDDKDFDTIVIGSGFGGSVTAYRLAQAKKSVLVLERGRPWPPGSFPRTPRDVAGIFWDPKHGRLGMFDVWSFSGITAITASGLGGGSLIYANVLARAPESTFRYPDGSEWPVRHCDLEPHYTAVERVIKPVPFPREHERLTPKTDAMRQAAAAVGKQWDRSPLAIAFAPGENEPPELGAPITDQPNLFGKPRCTCRLCGECDIGCNFGAKQTLDHTYLSQAAGAEIRTLSQVTAIAPYKDGYEVTYKQHRYGRDAVQDNLLGPDYAEVKVFAKRVVVAAGTVGTARLLLRNRINLPGLSGRLGHNFSSNGDRLMAVWNSGRELDMAKGPVITGTIRWERDKDRRMFQIQDAGAPVMAQWGFHLIDFPDNLAGLVKWWTWLRRKLMGDRDTNIASELADLIGPSKLSTGTLPLLAMGRDVAGGRFYLDGEDLELSWRDEDSREFFDEVTAAAREVAKALGGKFKDVKLGHYITVHSLGGCAMASHAGAGVVNEWGECFGHKGLFIADGSVLPGPVGPNPSLTIAALADRFACHMTGVTQP
jgi:cholesterol oxidase